MSSKIYKYLGSEVLNLALSKDGVCSFKCSYPKDFNDPYELFLTIDFQQDPDLLATYKDTIGDLPQLPTTCFSKSPSVIPMWAHYAHNHRGVVVEIDETKLSELMPDINFGDVDYLDSPREGLADMLARACRIGKPRYHYLLQSGVFSAAYYTKHTCWSYEQERRLVANDSLVKTTNDIMLLDLPTECISAIIAGHSTNDETKKMVRQLSNDVGAKYFEIKIGKTTATPYYIDSDGITYQYNSGPITKCESTCQKCKEPLKDDSKLCSWCAISEQHEDHAARTNPLRMLQEIGQLDDYYKGMQEIDRKHRKK